MMRTERVESGRRGPLSGIRGRNQHGPVCCEKRLNFIMLEALKCITQCHIVHGMTHTYEHKPFYRVVISDKRGPAGEIFCLKW